MNICGIFNVGFVDSDLPEYIFRRYFSAVKYDNIMKKYIRLLYIKENYRFCQLSINPDIKISFIEYTVSRRCFYVKENPNLPNFAAHGSVDNSHILTAHINAIKAPCIWYLK